MSEAGCIKPAKKTFHLEKISLWLMFSPLVYFSCKLLAASIKTAAISLSPKVFCPKVKKS
jgi:hypothetical protein